MFGKSKEPNAASLLLHGLNTEHNTSGHIHGSRLGLGVSNSYYVTSWIPFFTCFLSSLLWRKHRQRATEYGLFEILNWRTRTSVQCGSRGPTSTHCIAINPPSGKKMKHQAENLIIK